MHVAQINEAAVRVIQYYKADNPEKQLTWNQRQRQSDIRYSDAHDEHVNVVCGVGGLSGWKQQPIDITHGNYFIFTLNANHQHTCIKICEPYVIHSM